METGQRGGSGLRAWQERCLNPVIRSITGVNLWLLSHSDGRLGTRFLGRPVLLLTTVGRNSGNARTTPLFYLQDGERIVLVASRAGTSRNPNWYENIARNPRVTVQIAQRKRGMTARAASEAEVAELWPKLVAMFPIWDEFQKRSARTFPVVILDPSGEVLESRAPSVPS